MVDLVVVEGGPVDRGIVDGVKWSVLRGHQPYMPRSVGLPIHNVVVRWSGDDVYKCGFVSG